MLYTKINCHATSICAVTRMSGCQPAWPWPYPEVLIKVCYGDAIFMVARQVLLDMEACHHDG